MNIQISSDNIELTESMKSLATKKLANAEKMWSEIPEGSKSIRIVMNSGPNETFIVKIEATLNGSVLYTEEPGFQLETALVDAFEELLRKYKKMKTKIMQGDWQLLREQKTLSEDDLLEV